MATKDADTKEMAVETASHLEKAGNVGSQAQLAHEVYGDGAHVTVPEDIQGPWYHYLRKRWRLILKVAIIYIAVVNVGFDSSVTNTTLGMRSFRKYFGYENADGEYVISAKYVSAWAGGTSAGQISTDLLGGWLADRYGRKLTLLLSVIVIIIATTIQVTAQHIASIIVGKTVFGMGVGLYISFCTSYTAEIAPTRIRGAACMAVNFGIQLGSWVGSGVALGATRRFPDVNDERSFRVVLALQYIFAVCFIMAFYWLPESPIYFVNRDRQERAIKELKYMYGQNYDAARHVAFIYNEARAEQSMARMGKAISYRELFRGRNKIRMMVSACIIWPLTMGTAFWPNYQTYYFERAGASDPQAMNYGCTSVAIGTSLVAYFLIDSVGRRPLWIIGATGMACANMIGGLMYYPFYGGQEKTASRVATAMVFIWNGFYDIGPANMGYAITSEVPSSRMRVRNNAFVHVFSHTTGLAFSYLIPFLYQPDAVNLGLRMGIIWGACSFVWVIWAYFFIPELKKRNFYEIDQMFEHRVPVRKFGRAKFDERDALIIGSWEKKEPFFRSLVNRTGDRTAESTVEETR